MSMMALAAVGTVIPYSGPASFPRIRVSIALIFLATAALMPAVSQDKDPGAKPVLYVIGTAHLDSQWNWTVQDTIRQYVGRTSLDNFKLFERFPRYVFNYEGAIHFQ